MSKDLTAENLMRVFPAALSSSDSLRALASAIADELETLFEQNELLTIYTRIFLLPEALLDILAQDYKVDWYLPDGTEDSKRAQIASCFSVHRRLGTKSALVYALSALCPGTDVREWFEYGGDPFYFKIVLDLTRQTTPIFQADIYRVVKAVKPTRALLDDIIYRSRNTIAVTAVGRYASISARLCGTYPTRAIEGADDSRYVSLASAGAAVEYSTRLCGTPLGAVV